MVSLSPRSRTGLSVGVSDSNRPTRPRSERYRAIRECTGAAEPSRRGPEVGAVRSPRRCSRNACQKLAVATLTYVYADSTAVVGPLAAFSEAHSYDLCEEHARGLTAPKGWEVVRHDGDFAPAPHSVDDLVARAEAVREAARPTSSRDELDRL